ncbi:MAG TPA: hypothetical protein VNU97_04200 [Rhizomicrobium sp.]|jgi:hypothetical protein|nr:hypothetical protein [Rhizomicrobium sp.]
MARITSVAAIVICALLTSCFAIPAQAATVTVNNIAALVAAGSQATPPASVNVLGYANPGDGGGGIFTYNATCPGTPDTGIYIAVTVGCYVRTIGTQISNLDFAAPPDGVTDNSLAVQATFNAAAAFKVPCLIVPNSVFVKIQLTTVHNGITCTVDHAKRAIGLDKIVTGGLNFYAVSGATISIIDFDGQRTQQPVSEFVHSVTIYGGSNLHFPTATFVETRGDAMYISNTENNKKSYGAPTGLVIDTFSSSNSATDGRNGISVIVGSNFTFGSVTCQNIGGTINGIKEPGCVDLEPNSFADQVTNMTFGAITIAATGGAAGLSINGNVKAGVYDVNNVNFGNVTMTCAGVVLCGGLAHAGNVTLNLKASAASVGGYGANAGFQIDDINGLHGAIATTGLNTNYLGALTLVQNVGLTLNISNYGYASGCNQGYGLETGKLSNATLAGTITTPGTMCPVAGVYERGDGALSNVTFGLAILNPASGTIPTYGYQNAGGALSNVTILGSDCSAMPQARCLGSFPGAKIGNLPAASPGTSTAP